MNKEYVLTADKFRIPQITARLTEIALAPLLRVCVASAVCILQNMPEARAETYKSSEILNACYYIFARQFS